MLPSIFSSRWSMRRPPRMGRFHADPNRSAAYARSQRASSNTSNLRCVWTCCCGQSKAAESTPELEQ
ncbi:Gamma-tubulin complex component 2 [Frankliniella fusca]|uniref:Gamma-tubulin complex component 2 n=1 Tax=Frankliniella fusca TaxID=407009 RepID=A0AAE1LV05_9NEOP|nr:Gamma-tubulin complex component 2 [Frankliniella fusca]